jgi:type I restriction enzyme S subunit
VASETVMIASQGTLGENEVFCEAFLVTGAWLDFAYSEHFLRVISTDPDYPGAYLFALLRSEAVFRCLRSMSCGSKQQDLHPALIRTFPVPACTLVDRMRVADAVRAAYRMRDEADRAEDDADRILTEAIEAA